MYDAIRKTDLYNKGTQVITYFMVFVKIIGMKLLVSASTVTIRYGRVKVVPHNLNCPQHLT